MHTTALGPLVLDRKKNVSEQRPAYLDRDLFSSFAFAMDKAIRPVTPSNDADCCLRRRAVELAGA